MRVLTSLRTPETGSPTTEGSIKHSLRTTGLWLFFLKYCDLESFCRLYDSLTDYIDCNQFHAIMLDCLMQVQNDDDDETGENVPMTMYVHGNKFMEEFFEQVFPSFLLLF